MPTAHRTWIEVSRGALTRNFGQFKRFFDNKALIAPVIKANAYGHGVSNVVKTLARAQIWGFCVAYDTEAIDLRKKGITSKILVLSAWNRKHLDECIEKKIRLVVWDRNAALRIAAVARRRRTRAIVHLKLDTGTTRIGTRPEHFNALLRTVQKNRWLEFEGVFSHYADSESANLATARQQRSRFIEHTASLDVPLRHLACTAASLRLPLAATNLVRLGIGLYGLWPSEATKRSSKKTIALEPVLSWYTNLLQIKRVPKGTRVGYVGTYATARSTYIGILPIGYSDGYARQASNRSNVVINGSSYPVVGKVSMNLVTIDLGPRLRVHTDDRVTLIGEGVSADDLAQQWGTINYEVISRIDRAVPRMSIA